MPRVEPLPAVATVAAVAALATVAWTGVQAREVRSMLDSVLPAKPQAPETMQTLTEDVKTDSGRTITVTTTRGADEGVDAFIGRHDEAVQAAKAL